MSDQGVIYRVDFPDGTSCHYGQKWTAVAYARRIGTVHEIPVRDLRLVDGPCQTCESLARAVMMDQTSHDKVIAHPGVQGLAQLGRNAIDRVQELQQANVALAGALDMIRETLNGVNVEDLLYIINDALEKYRRTA